MNRVEYRKAMEAGIKEFLNQFHMWYDAREREIEKLETRLEQANAYVLLLSEFDRIEKMYAPYIQFWKHPESSNPSPFTIPDCPQREPIDKAIRESVIQKYGCMCAYCGKKGDKTHGPDGASWHIDHIIPHSWGGPHETSNFALSCRSCNLSKSNMWWQPARRVTHV